MDAITRDKLLKCGMNIEVTLDRFMGSEDLLIKFLKKFLADDNYQKLIDSVQAQDFEKAFNASHTLKGVSANLGLDSLNLSTQKIVEKFRAKDYTNYEDMLDEITKEYNTAIEVIESL